MSATCSNNLGKNSFKDLAYVMFQTTLVRRVLIISHVYSQSSPLNSKLDAQHKVSSLSSFSHHVVSRIASPLHLLPTDTASGQHKES